MTSLTLQQFSTQIVGFMPAIIREFVRREDNALIHGKISLPQMVALQHILTQGRACVGEIAAILSTKKSSASTLLERLECDGMVRRRHDKVDRRMVWVTVTPKGKKVIRQIMNQKKESIGEVFGCLSAKEREQYASLIRKVAKAVSVGVACLVWLSSVSLPSAYAALWPWKLNKPRAEAAVATQEQEKFLTLKQAYDLALRQSESLKVTREDIEQAQARFYRSFDYFLPTVRYKITRSEQDVSAGSSGSSFDFSRRVQRSQRFTFSQPLFSGFKEIAALSGTGADKKAQRLRYQRAQETLFLEVAEAYYGALLSVKQQQVLAKISVLLSERIEDLKKRVDLGRSRESELQNATADLKILEADRLTQKKAAAIAVNLLEFYLGEKLGDRELSIDNGESVDWIPDLTRAEMRSDVEEAEQNYIVQQKKVISANSRFFPEINLDGNYYTKREGFQDGNDWDVLLTFDIPVFEIGGTLGDVKEAASNREKARLAWERKKRSALVEAQNAYEEYSASQEVHRSLLEAERAAKENYEILQKEFEQNLVNNLEVLDALRRYEDVQRRFLDAQFAAKTSYWNLRAALGEITGALDHP